jgi:hypothetical protein
MADIDLIGAVLAGAMITIEPWFYRHCCRPALAMASAPPIAFDIVLLCNAGMSSSTRSGRPPGARLLGSLFGTRVGSERDSPAAGPLARSVLLQ